MGVIVVTGCSRRSAPIDRSVRCSTPTGRILLIKIIVFLGLMVVAAVVETS
jgi:putative copper export protein